MFTVYILFQRKLKSIIQGQTQNFDNRLLRHNSGETKSIKSGIPWILIWKQEVSNRTDAVRLQRKIKMYGVPRDF